MPTKDNGPYPPDVEAYLDAHPDVAAEFARVHGHPWEQRRIQIQPFQDSHADVKAWFDNHQPWIKCGTKGTVYTDRKADSPLTCTGSVQVD